MDGLKRTRPPRQAAPGTSIGNGSSGLDCNALRDAAATALARELWIIQQAARRCCGYWTLTDDDVERVDQACGHVLAVLAALLGREITQ